MVHLVHHGFVNSVAVLVDALPLVAHCGLLLTKQITQAFNLRPQVLAHWLIMIQLYTATIVTHNKIRSLCTDLPYHDLTDLCLDYILSALVTVVMIWCHPPKF